MYKVAICDDEEIFADDLKIMVQNILKDLNANFEISICTNPQTLLNILDKTPDAFHIIMLDILLNKKVNGVELAKHLRKKGIRSSILFITSSKDYTLDGYSVYPIHYLIKPINKEQLHEVLKRDYCENFIGRHIILPSNSEHRIILLDDIFYIEMLNRKIIIHTSDEDIEYPKNLKDIMSDLPEDLFVRCHKSFIVSMSKLERFSKTKFVLRNGCEVPVGRAYYKEAIAKFFTFLDQD